jgi:hypothetical protein
MLENKGTNIHIMLPHCIQLRIFHKTIPWQQVYQSFFLNLHVHYNYGQNKQNVAFSLKTEIKSLM